VRRPTSLPVAIDRDVPVQDVAAAALSAKLTSQRAVFEYVKT
jgi:hypothetical protein